MKLLCLLCVLCGSVFPSFALDRNAFTFTRYDLDLRVEPEQQRLGVRGKITLRNDSTAPQKSLALQISSTLDWRAIQVEGKPVQFLTHSYTSDIDHTGALSEAIVTLPREVSPKATVELDIGYEGTIPLDTTRLTRIGVPADKAKHNDWDEISKSFTAVRGIGSVAWYSVATDAASLSEPDRVSETVGRWVARHAASEMSVTIQSTTEQDIFFSGTHEPKTQEAGKIESFKMSLPGVSVPTFVIASYQELSPTDVLQVNFLPGQQEAAETYADAASQITPIVPKHEDATFEILALPDHDAPAFVTQGILLVPLKTPMTNQAELDMVYALARQSVPSARAWIQEGLSHFALAAFIEEQKGRQAALDYLEAHRAALVEAEKRHGDKSDRALVSAPDDLYLQTKSMFVWWMLKDILGSLPKDALLAYHAADDKDASYLQKLLEKQSHRDLQWFFDDWVDHDRGLPDFRVASVFSTPIDSGGQLVTITVENLGNAGAEVPVTLEMETGEIRRRLEVHAKSKTSVRIEAPSPPKEVTINDGSVPESDITNNTYKIGVAVK